LTSIGEEVALVDRFNQHCYKLAITAHGARRTRSITTMGSHRIRNDRASGGPGRLER
jgi:hypothetical protein